MALSFYSSLPCSTVPVALRRELLHPSGALDSVAAKFNICVIHHIKKSQNKNHDYLNRCRKGFYKIQHLFMIKTLNRSGFRGFMCCAKSLQSCPTLCDPMDYNWPSSSVHGILQTRVLQQVAMPSSKGSSQPRDQTHISCVSCIGR